MADTHSSTNQAVSTSDSSVCRDPENPAGPGSARWDLASHLRLWPVAVIGLILDLWTKHWAFTQLDSDPNAKSVVIPHLLSFQQSLNAGALFGLGKGWTALFIAASVLALGFVLFLFIHSERTRYSLHLALGLVLAGALGNLYDRAFCAADVITYTRSGTEFVEVFSLIQVTEDGSHQVGTWPDQSNPRTIPASWNPRHREQGVVRDFIRMEPRITIGSWSFDVWPWVFNLADAWLVTGVGLLMLNFWWDRKADKAAQAAASA